MWFSAIAEYMFFLGMHVSWQLTIGPSTTSADPAATGYSPKRWVLVYSEVAGCVSCLSPDYLNSFQSFHLCRGVAVLKSSHSCYKIRNSIKFQYYLLSVKLIHEWDCFLYLLIFDDEEKQDLVSIDQLVYTENNIFIKYSHIYYERYFAKLCTAIILKIFNFRRFGLC